jgi:hypothetical protein
VAYSVPNLAQLRPLIVGWSTLCRADWARNDSVRTTMQCPPATPLRPSFSGELPGAMRAASKHQGLSLMGLGRKGGDLRSTSPRSLDDLA